MNEQQKSIIRLIEQCRECNSQGEINKKMNCWHCSTELIWGGDHDTDENEDYDIVSNLSCPECHAAVDVWHPSEKLIKEYKDYKEKNDIKKCNS